MKFKELNFDDLNTAYPKSTNIELSSFLEDERKEYLSLYNLYRRLFSEYIIKKIDLKLFDEKIVNSELGFTPLSNEKMDIYQYFSSDELIYLYIRNNIYIEKLTKEQVKFLKQRIKSKNFTLDKEAEKLIEDSYQKVIFEDLLQDGKKYNILFGPDSKSFLAPNNSIVIGFRYDEYNKDGLDDGAWFEKHISQIKFLKEIFDEMQEVFNEKLPEGTKIINYNDMSIIPRKRKKSK